MTKLFATAALAAAVCSLPSAAVETRFWTQDDQSAFEKGKLTRLSLRNDGRLMLAPEFREIADAGVPYLWALAADSKGNLYSGGGGPSSSTAKLFQVSPGGQSKVIAELPGMEIHAIAVNRHDQVFAATSPDGKVYRIDAVGKAEVYYDPQAKYIWGMAFDSKGNLYVATGDHGEVHRVTPDGRGSVFFKSEETHARSITVDANDNVIAGTEPGGLILRISPAGEGFVLYQAPKREITAVAVGKDGAIFATGVGSKGGSSAPVPPTFNIPLPQPQASAAPGSPQTAAPKPLPVPSPMPSPAREASVSGGSDLYRIEKDGYPRRIWSQAQDIAYAIGFDAQGRPVIGTGNKGNIYRIDSDNAHTLLINATPTQVTGFASAPRGALFAATGNIGRVYQVGPGLEQSGTLESESFDVGSFSYWGRLSHLAETNNGKVTFETRSGNLDRTASNWSPWAPVDAANGARVASPSARFLQYRLTVQAAADGKSPEVRAVEIAYEAKNVAPTIDDIEATPPNYRFQPSPLSSSTSQSITLPPMGQAKRHSAGISLDSAGSQSMQYGKGQMGARWLASDANGDDLIFKVEIKGAGETEWKLLRDKVKERYLSWDSNAFADGDYQLRITASDTPDNPPEQALTAQLVSERFLIDNTSPVISNLAVVRSGSKVVVKWSARDDRSIISKAEYSLNGGDWTPAEPTTRLSDSLEHQYELSLDGARAGENTIAVRVRDDYDNEAVSKAIVK